jgi:hypothetical protein
MKESTPNFIIQEGPEKGREIRIPEEGARIGRATENDINIADAAMSRFQCRMYFREGFLHIMDLGSTNESLVNGKPVTDQALRYGDEVLIGESILKVINDGLAGASAKPPPPPAASSEEPAPAPIIFNMGGDEPSSSPEPEPAPAVIPDPPQTDETPDNSSGPHSALVEVDLGFGKKNEFSESSSDPEKRSVLPLILVTLVTMLVVFSVGIIVLMSNPEPEVVTQPKVDRVQLSYERVIAGDGNVFRYALQLDENGVLSAEIHDIEEQRNIIREKKLEPDTLKEFSNQLLNRKQDFIKLDEAYERAVSDSLNSNEITLIFGNEAKNVRTVNHPQPDTFTAVRELLEGFAQNQLGLRTLQKPPAELRAEAAVAWSNSQSLYAKREVKYENLYQAIQKLREVRFLLQDIEPKPDYYDQALELEQSWGSELKNLVNDLVFEANRASQINQKQETANYLRRILKTYPEKSSSIYIQAYNNLRRIEQELNP